MTIPVAAAVLDDFDLGGGCSARAEDLGLQAERRDVGNRRLVLRETAGMPASMRCTPSESSFLAIATFSSRRKTTAVCCSPSRKVTS